MVGKALRAKRIGAAISGYAVCLKIGIGRSRLSDIERGHVRVARGGTEITRIYAATDEGNLMVRNVGFLAIFSSYPTGGQNFTAHCVWGA